MNNMILKAYAWVAVLASAGVLQAKAQGYFSENMFNHVAVGVTAGTPGIGFDVATTVGNHFQLRVGYAAMPKVKVSTDLGIEGINGLGSASVGYAKYDVEGKLNIGDAKLLVDYFPFIGSSFHITAGAYIGSTKIIKCYNKEEGSLMALTNYNNTVSTDQQIGLALGDYLLKPDEYGNVEASIKVSGFKPYLGIGFGRAVPKKNRVGFMFKLGCQFWGSPKVYTFDRELKSDDLGSDDGKFIKVLSKISVYPVINFRLCGRIL